MVASQVAERTVSRLLPDMAPSPTEGREEHSPSVCGLRQSAGHVTSHRSGSVFKTRGKTGPRSGRGRGSGARGGGRGGWKSACRSSRDVGCGDAMGGAGGDRFFGQSSSAVPWPHQFPKAAPRSALPGAGAGPSADGLAPIDRALLDISNSGTTEKQVDSSKYGPRTSAGRAKKRKRSKGKTVEGAQQGPETLVETLRKKVDSLDSNFQWLETMNESLRKEVFELKALYSGLKPAVANLNEDLCQLRTSLAPAGDKGSCSPEQHRKTREDVDHLSRGMAVILHQLERMGQGSADLNAFSMYLHGLAPSQVCDSVAEVQGKSNVSTESLVAIDCQQGVGRDRSPEESDLGGLREDGEPVRAVLDAPEESCQVSSGPGPLENDAMDFEEGGLDSLTLSSKV